MKNILTFEEMYNRFLHFRRVSGRKELTIRSLLYRFFERRKNYNTEYLTQEMVDDWCEKSPGETNVSNTIRILSILSFLRYVVNEKKWVKLKIPKTPPHAYETAVPHSFTDEELNNMFLACDEIIQKWDFKMNLFPLEISVMLRLMLSAGLRPIEARMLRCKDVNLSNGIVNIENTKGYRKHIVVLHDSMLELMKSYDQKVKEYVKEERTYFFPHPDGGYNDVYWLNYWFHKVWYKYNTAKATVGMLRHHYAIQNINTVIRLGKKDMMTKLLSLCKSMGHRSLVSTMWYYSLIPRLADVIDSLSGDSYKKMIPKLSYDETKERGS
ncbi:MAG: tyrosine-type recombinase/integrase [Prevotella sp.]|jgi:integrase|nr:tyrosine-type recombinase/integrase [Prevotella sp.]MBR1558511.1 tyrosine-type recombinase/integrase [Prevotella sp.]MCR5644209.1 tyrosine-type recombinase/integrase [Prevotella sp.]